LLIKHKSRHLKSPEALGKEFWKGIGEREVGEEIRELVRGRRLLMWGAEGPKNNSRRWRHV
jgi:hypothetical protein